MENAFWFYKVTWYFDNEVRHNQGFICANSFAEAAEKIDNSYDDVEEMSIVYMDLHEVLDFEDILDMGATFYENKHSEIGHQVLEAIEEAVAAEKGE